MYDQDEDESDFTEDDLPKDLKKELKELRDLKVKVDKDNEDRVHLWKESRKQINEALTAQKVRKINAAFGSFIIAVITGLSLPLGVLFNDLFNIIWAVFLIGVWESFIVWIGTTIILIYGTSDTVTMQDKKIQARLDAFEDRTEQRMAAVEAYVNKPYKLNQAQEIESKLNQENDGDAAEILAESIGEPK